MKAKVAVYDSHKKAVDAVKKMVDSGFDANRISLLNKADNQEDHLSLKSIEEEKNMPLFVGIGAGTLVGLLTGLGVFAIPGFGFLYGAGAIIGAFAGLDAGIISGGLLSVLTKIGIKNDTVIKHEKHLHDGKTLVIYRGTEEELENAEKVLHTEGTHLEITD